MYISIEYSWRREHTINLLVDQQQQQSEMELFWAISSLIAIVGRDGEIWFWASFPYCGSVHSDVACGTDTLSVCCSCFLFR